MRDEEDVDKIFETKVYVEFNKGAFDLKPGIVEKTTQG